MKKRIILIIKILIVLGLLALIVVFGINQYVVATTKDYVYTDVNELPDKQVIIVLGAYVNDDRLSMVLEDRVKSGILLYEDERAPKLLLSGDHGRQTYDEVNTMRKYILNHANVEQEDVFLDHAGFDTYDTMYRARDVFQVESAIIVTQDFHINRAVYIARSLGIDAVGYSVNQDKYKKVLQMKWSLRESLSRLKAFADVTFGASPKFLGEPIPITGDGRLTWDEE